MIRPQRIDGGPALGNSMQDNRKYKALVIIPAYNECKNIGKVIKGIREIDQAIDVLVIDDGSSDGTAFHARSNGARVITLLSNMGYGVALQAGYKYAYQNGYDCLVQLDADCQHDPVYIPELLRVITSGETDLVLGSRFLQKGLAKDKNVCEHVPGIFRKLGIRLFAFLTTLLVGFKVTDPTSGYQAINRDLITFFTHDFFPSDYPDADVIVLAHRAGFKIKELPMVIYEKNSGNSMHCGVRPVYYGFKMLLSLLMTLLRHKPVFLPPKTF